MIKLRYRLMTPGVKNFINIWGETFKLDPIWRVPLYSQERYVIASDEDTACAMVRKQLKVKYEGFRVMGIDNI